MISLENKLLKYINSKKTREAHNIYIQIIDIYQSMDLNYDVKLRQIKNYLICLNTIIYTNYLNHIICKKRLLNIRNNFIKEIEEHSSIKELIATGSKMIDCYISMNCGEVPTKNPIIRDALNYIEKNLDKNLSLENVSRSIHVSKNYLSYLFSKCTGYSFSYYINKLKIEKSKELLIDTNLPLIDIAIECGFNSQSYFCRVFNQFEGISPKQYRLFHLK